MRYDDVLAWTGPRWMPLVLLALAVLLLVAVVAGVRVLNRAAGTAERPPPGGHRDAPRTGGTGGDIPGTR
jgi:hypothetical protein